MSIKDNDSLEDFFRKATRHHDLQFNEEDWKKLERRLDEEQPVPPVGWFGAHGRKALLGLAFLVGVVAVLLLLPGQDVTEGAGEGVTGTTDKVDSGIASAPNAPGDQSEGDPRSSEGGKSAVDRVTDQSALSRSEDGPQVSEAIRENAAQGGAPERNMRIDAERSSGNRPTRRADVSSAAAVDNNRISTAGSGSDTEKQAAENINIEKDPSEVSGFNRMQPEPPAPAERMVNESEALTQVQDQAADSASVETTADALEAPRRKTFDETRSRFSISVVAAPDFSKTANGGSMGTGDAIGAFFHYQVLPRWGVSAGAMYTNKKYWGKGNEYRPPTGYWKALTNGVVPDRIDGTCSMYEVPVAVTFDILSTRRIRLFASAGVSSYFVQSEEYYYHFDTPNPGAVNGWTGKKPSTLWFGIGTLSAGFDFRATRTLSVGIEPYFKVPLEGMGWADIDLYSTGVMFAARYHFARKATKHPPSIQGP